MSWVKIDDQFFTHPKVLAAGKDGRALFIAGLCYSASHLTDGLVPTAALGLVASSADVPRRSTAKRLVDVGLWHEVGDGWKIHDYHDHQPYAEAVKAQRDEVSRRRSEAGRKGAAARWSDGKADGKGDGTGKANGIAKPKQADGKAIAPSPSPSPSSSSSPPQRAPETRRNEAGAGAPTEEDPTPTPTDRVDAAIDHMALCDEILHRADGKQIRNRNAWLKAARTNRRTEHLAELTQLAAEQPGRDPVALAEAIDPRCGPLDGGTARSAADWERTRAELEAERDLDRQRKADTARADELLAELGTDQRDQIRQRAIAELPPKLADSKPLIRQTERRLILEETNR